ncbi:hypothetical protein ABZS86_11385 [Streptomyces sp. NPDC005355]|uniref:hypothetical protein n=1 Tax=Streptomyces sp. NPDC005355 TaxID=3157038 RepID=UPI0033A8E991
MTTHAELTTLFQNARTALRELADGAAQANVADASAGALVARATWLVADERKLTLNGSSITALLGSAGNSRQPCNSIEQAAS